MGYERKLIKKVMFNNETFTLINDSPSRYDNEYWHHLEIVYKGFTLVKIQSPSRKLLYEALKRSILVFLEACKYSITWPETIWVNMDIPGKHEAWLKEQEDNMAKRALEIQAEKEAIPHYDPSILDIIKANRKKLEHTFSLSLDNTLIVLASKTDRELDEIFDFTLKHMDRSINVDLHLSNFTFTWLNSQGLLNNSLNNESS
jgi:hypothetical protein